MKKVLFVVSFVALTINHLCAMDRDSTAQLQTQALQVLTLQFISRGDEFVKEAFKAVENRSDRPLSYKEYKDAIVDHLVVNGSLRQDYQLLSPIAQHAVKTSVRSAVDEFFEDAAHQEAIQRNLMKWQQQATQAPVPTSPSALEQMRRLWSQWRVSF